MLRAPDIIGNVAAAPPSHPDWANVEHEVICPLCDYNLRGLTHSQCPECGYRFDWPELLDPKRRAHPYLFEHHHERNFWSFFKTLNGTRRPTKFWRNVHPTQPSRPKRILIYGMISMAPLLLTWIAYAVVITELEFARYYYALRASFNGAGKQHLPALSLLRIRVMLQQAAKHDDLFRYGLTAVVWPWLTLAGLMVFRWSMKRANVKGVHILRCVVYSADLSLVVFLLFLWLAAEACGFDSRLSIPPTTLSNIWIAGVGIFLSLFIFRLMCAGRLYLRFDHVVAMILATQFMAGLIVWKLIYLVQGY